MPAKLTHQRPRKRKPLVPREHILLNAAQSRRFVKRLLAEPRPPTPRMAAAIRAYKASVKSDLD